MKFWKKGGVVLATVALFGSGVVVANAATPAAATVKYAACLSSTTKTLSDVTINLAPKCPSGSRLVTWNAAGPSGIEGKTGATGKAGVAGVAGVTGPEGPAGPVGATGPAGPAGATGPAGPAGAPGTNVADGVTCPAGGDVTGFDSSGNVLCSVSLVATSSDDTGTQTWGGFSGFGLGSDVAVLVIDNEGTVGVDYTSENGTITGGEMDLNCVAGILWAYVQSTAADGDTINSNRINNPCG